MPAAVEASNGVKTKYERGDTTTVWNFFLERCLDSTKPAHLRLFLACVILILFGWGFYPDPNMTTRSRSSYLFNTENVNNWNVMDSPPLVASNSCVDMVLRPRFLYRRLARPATRTFFPDRFIVEKMMSDSRDPESL